MTSLPTLRKLPWLREMISFFRTEGQSQSIIIKGQSAQGARDPLISISPPEILSKGPERQNKTTRGL
jgi:hypothetical protein